MQIQNIQIMSVKTIYNATFTCTEILSLGVGVPTPGCHSNMWVGGTTSVSNQFLLLVSKIQQCIYAPYHTR